MSFRKYGGANYSEKNNIIKNNYTTTNNLTVTDKITPQTIGNGGNGTQGPQGPTGPQGVQILTGFTGPQGPQGIPGLNGGTNYWGQTGTNIYYTNGSVGIGTNNPQALLDINNTWSFNSSLPLNITNIAVSSTGQYQTVIDNYNKYYVSNNYGKTWTTFTLTGVTFNQLAGLTISTTGQYQFITYYTIINSTTASSGFIYSNTYGATWTTPSANNVLSGVVYNSAISQSGSTIAVVSSSPSDTYTEYPLQLSTNSGATWTTNMSVTPTVSTNNPYKANWGGLAMSSSGTYITASSYYYLNPDFYYGQILVSSNSGSSFTAIQNTADNKWINLKMSSTGQIQIAVEITTYFVWISSNYGSTWAQMAGTNAYKITSLNISSDGTIITGASNGSGDPSGGYIWQGVNTNGTWIWKQLTSSKKLWVSLATSTDTTYKPAIIYQGGLYTNNLALNVNGSSQFNGNLLPAQANTYNLGSPSVPWKSLYVSSNTINLGNQENGYASVSYEHDTTGTSTDNFVLVKTDGTRIVLGETINRSVIRNIIDTTITNNDLLKLKVGTIDTSNNIVGLNDINQLLFDLNSGFDVTQGPTGGSAIVGMNSTFKFWNVDGSNGITASGLDTVNFVSGTGIKITAEENNGTKTLKIDSLLEGLTGPTGPKGDVGLQGEVGPIGTVDLSILNNYARLDGSNNWTGKNFFPTLDLSNVSQQPATTEFVNNKIYNVLGTTSEFADQITTLNNALSDLSGGILSSLTSSFAPIKDPSFTGIPVAPTPDTNGNTNQIATKGYVDSAITNNNSNSSLGILQNSPPAPTLDPSGAIVSSTSILIRFTPPSQSTWGFANFLIPAINSFNFRCDGSGGYVSELLNGTTSQYVRVYPNATNTSIVSGICLINSPGVTVYGETNITANTIRRIVYDGDPRYYYVILATNANLYNTGNTINIWYTNYNTISAGLNKTTINFNMYLTIGVPAPPSNFRQSTVPTTTTFGTAWDASLSDMSNPSTPATFDNYKITITVDPTNSPIGYGWTNPGPTTQFPAGTATTYTITSLYPSTSYNAYIQAKNTSNVNYSSNSNTINFQTTNLPPLLTTLDSTVQSLTIPTNATWNNISSAFRVGDPLYNTNPTNVTNLYYTTNTSTILITNKITIPIQNTIGLIGSTSSNIRNITVILEKDIVSNTTNYVKNTGPTVTYGGFNTTTPASNTSNNLKIYTSGSTDQYSASSIGSRGYYQQVDLSFGISLTTPQTIITDSTSLYTLSIVDNSNSIGIKTFPFYYTILPPAPTATLTTISLGSLTNLSQQYFGINIFTNPIPINTTLNNIQNIGTYFCNTGNFLTYGITGGGSLTNNIISKIPSANISNNIINSSFSYTNNNMFFSTTSYLTSISGFNVKIQGLTQFATITNSTTFPVLYDPLTTSFINSLPTNIPIITSTLARGFNCIIPTNITTGGANSPYYNTPSTAYRTVAYDHTQSLLTNSALLMSNGAYITPANSIYINYLNFNGNSTYNNNYTTITSTNGMRYVAFVWQVPAFSTVPIGSVTVQITFKNANLTKPGTTEVIVAGAAAGSLELYYRLEDPESYIKTGSLIPSSTDYYSTIWIKGNSPGTALSATNFASTANETSLFGATTSTTSTVATFTLTIPTISKTVTQPIYFYLRVGLNSNVNNAITNILCSL